MLIQSWVVLIGYDSELVYSKWIDAFKLINAGTDFIATHCDPVCPSKSGSIPYIGLLTEMIEKKLRKRNLKH